MSYLTDLEKQQLKFDWRYKGVSILNLLTDSEAESMGEELERIRILRQENDTKGEWLNMTHLCIHIKNQKYLVN